MPHPVASKTEAMVEPAKTETKVEVKEEPKVEVIQPINAPKSSEAVPNNKKATRTRAIDNGARRGTGRPVPTKSSGRNYSKEEVQTLIISYSEQYGISPDTPLCIAKYESGYNQHSKNKRSSASGVFQYLSGTWKATDEGKAGQSVFDADANVKAAVKYMASRKDAQPWEVRGKCPQVKSK